MRITKTLEISTGHRLHLHKGGCSNFHGHNYQITVNIDFQPTKDEYIDNVGFYIDFKDIKEIINKNYDHQFLIFSGDPLLEQAKKLPGIRIVDFPPTAENITREMVNKIGEEILKNVSDEQINRLSVAIKLYETLTSCAEVQKDFNIIK